MSVDPCSNESQFEKKIWKNPVRVIYSIHHSIISFKNKVCQTVFIFCKMWHTKSSPDCVLAVDMPICFYQNFLYESKHE